MPLPRGFSLVEVTVSIFIVGVMLILLQAVVHSGVLVRTAKNQGVALSIARNELEKVRAGGYASIPPSGSFSDTLMSALPIAATATIATSTYNAKTQQVTISVVWLETGAAASTTVSLTTLITQIGGLP